MLHPLRGSGSQATGHRARRRFLAPGLIVPLMISAIAMGLWSTGKGLAAEQTREWPSAQHKTGKQEEPPCTCRYYGEEFRLGETICMKGQEGKRIAICVMVINNPSWEKTGAECPSAQLSPRRSLEAPVSVASLNGKG